MKVIKKILKGILIFILSILVLIALLDAAWINIPQVTAKNINDLDKYEKEVSALNIPANAKVIGLGEATHGNVEFQELKLDVFKLLVEKYGVKVFTLETDFGAAHKVNSYIHGGEGTIEDALVYLQFTIYQTAQMEELIVWMRDYNATVPESEQLSFYGFDMQYPIETCDLVKEFCEKYDLYTDRLDVLASAVNGDEAGYKLADNILSELRNNADKYCDDEDYEIIMRMCECILMHKQFLEIGFNEFVASYDYRDSCMAQNISWIYDYESAKGNDSLMVSAHNGHAGYAGTFYKTMGANLKEIFADKYFVIGTDYYKAKTNIAHNNGGRKNFSFCSADPLAKQAKKFGGSYYINFSEVEEGSVTYDTINSNIHMGSLGEGAAYDMYFIPASHRINVVPTDLYDAMILVYKATPIEVY